MLDCNAQTLRQHYCPTHLDDYRLEKTGLNSEAEMLWKYYFRKLRFSSGVYDQDLTCPPSHVMDKE